MIHPEIRPEGPSFLRILLGMLKIIHLKQFVVIFLSISILLLFFRILSINTFFFLLLVCGFLLILLTLIDYLIKRYRLHQHQQQKEEELVPLIDNNASLEEQYSAFKSHIRYDLKYYSKTEFPDVPDICGVCLQTIPEGTEVAVLPCMHIFHPKCIEKWTKVNNSCPFCKATIV
ncbi:hypothetical protein M9Y10_041268 [Tritrichomonas musculus]|uniref:RING-type domain-containing protein n=1 Tax=Tritrichomonas musculus TaxID=1915356 RepID=A0ABR2K400_9EUKA